MMAFIRGLARSRDPDQHGRQGLHAYETVSEARTKLAAYLDFYTGGRTLHLTGARRMTCTSVRCRSNSRPDSEWPRDRVASQIRMYPNPSGRKRIAWSAFYEAVRNGHTPSSSDFKEFNPQGYH
jgi:hypothetical protein